MLIFSRVAVCTLVAGALILMAVFSDLATFLWIDYPALQMLTAAIIAGAALFVLRVRPSPAFWGLLAYGGYMSLVSVAGVFITQNPLHMVQVVMFLLLPLGLLVLGHNTSEREILRLLIGLLVLFFTFTIGERLGFWFGFRVPGLSEFSLQMKLAAFARGEQFPVLNRATGLFINPNALGYFAGCLAFSILFLSKNRAGVGNTTLFLMSFMLIAMSGSRGSILALFTAILTYLLYIRSGRALIPVALAMSVIALAYFAAANQEASTFALFVDRIQNDSSAGSGSWTGRLQFWSSVWERGNLPIGTFVSPELVLGHAIDSFYVRVLAQGGVIGLVSGLLLFAGLLMQGARLPAHLKGPYMALIVFMLVNGFSMQGVQNLEGVFVWAVVGIAARLSVATNIELEPKEKKLRARVTSARTMRPFQTAQRRFL